MGDPENAVLVAVTADGVAPLPLSAAALSLLPSLPEDTALVSEPAVAALALLVLPAVSGCTKESSSKAAPADPTDTVIARVNGVEIRQSDIAFAEEDFSNELRDVGRSAFLVAERLQALERLCVLIAAEFSAREHQFGRDALFFRAAFRFEPALFDNLIELVTELLERARHEVMRRVEVTQQVDGLLV